MERFAGRPWSRAALKREFYGDLEGRLERALLDALNRICATDTALRERFFSALLRYKERFILFVDRLRKENPDMADGGVSTWMHRDEDEDGNQINSVEVEAPNSIISVSGVPDFQMPSYSLGEAVESAIPDLAIMLVEVLPFFIAAVVAFLRYDVRP